MKGKRFTDRQIIEILKQRDAGVEMADLCREYDVSPATIYGWKAKYGGAEGNEAQRLKQIEDENRRLKELVADLSLDREALKTIIRKNGKNLTA
jgi:putative transposase